MPRHASWAPAQPRCRALGARSTRGARLGPKQVSQCSCVAQRATGPSGSPSPSSCRQKESRETESYAPDVKFKVAAPLRSRADLEVELVLRLLGPIAVVSHAGDREPNGWVWRVAVAGPLCHEHLEARGRCRTVVTRPVRAARLHVRVLDVLPHGWYRQTSCRWPRATEGHWCL